jgi:uncharacterized protein
MTERMCIVTRDVRDEAELIRFVRSPDGVAVPDLARKLPGRGVWVTVSREKLAEACKRSLFSRGFGEETKAPPELVDQVSKLLRSQAVASLSLARKAGEAVSGFMKVDEAMRRGPVRVLLHAPGAGGDGVSKLKRLARPETLVSALLSSDEMDLAFGRANVVHAAVAAGGIAEKLVLHLQRLAAYELNELDQRLQDERHDQQQ